MLGLSDSARLSTSTSGITANALNSRAGLAHRRAAGGANPSAAVSRNSTPMAMAHVGGWNPIPAGSGGRLEVESSAVVLLMAGATPTIKATPKSPNNQPGDRLAIQTDLTRGSGHAHGMLGGRHTAPSTDVAWNGLRSCSRTRNR